jgi:hypothetical protein
VVKKVLSSVLLMASCSLWAGEVVVQSSGAPPKSAKSIEIGQRFECVSDVRLEVYGCPLWFRAGTIGVRVSEAEFYLATGSVRIGALPPAPRFGFPREPLLVRFGRGELEATGLEWLSVRDDGQVRWWKQASTGLSKISIDGLVLTGEADTLLTASEDDMVVLKSSNAKGFELKDLEDSSWSELMLNYRRLRDAEASLSTRSQIIEPWFSDSIFEREKKLAIRRGRRYGGRP